MKKLAKSCCVLLRGVLFNIRTCLSFKVISALVAKLYHNFVTVYRYFRLLNILMTDCLTSRDVFTEPLGLIAVSVRYF